MSKPPEKIEDFHDQPAEFWFGEHPIARCGNVTVELHYHPYIFTKAPYRIEAFGTSLGGTVWHRSGDGMDERPSDEDFVRLTLKALEMLREGGDWYPKKTPAAATR